MKYNITTSGHLRLQATDPSEAQRLRVMADQASQANYPVGYDPNQNILVFPIEQAGQPTQHPGTHNPDNEITVVGPDREVDCPKHGTRVPALTLDDLGPYCRSCLDEHLSDALPDAQPSTGDVRP